MVSGEDILLLITFFFLIVQKKKTRVLVRLPGQKIQQETRPKSTKTLTLHPACLHVCAHVEIPVCLLSICIHVVLYSHLCLDIYVHVCPENSEMQHTTSGGKD